MALSLPHIGAVVADASPCVSPPPAVQSAFLPPKPGISLKATRGRSNARWPTPILATPQSVSSATIPSPSASPSSSAFNQPTGWTVVLASSAISRLSSKAKIIDCYVSILSRVLGSEKQAQKSIYHASWESHFGFCCDVDKEASGQLANIPGVLSVRPDEHPESTDKDYSYSNPTVENLSKSHRHFSEASVSVPGGSSKYWLVRMEKPGVEVVTKAQIVDYYAQTLTKVLRNEKDSEVSIYHISWEKYFGFCCQIDEDCAQELAGVPGVLSVHPDINHGSNNKDYRGSHLEPIDPCTTNRLPNGSKRLFVTGLSFYTSEKTLRAAFEGFGELVEVKVIMDKISKRSKGYAFIEYTTEEAAEAALREMNGKIINGWMIVVDVAKSNPPKYSKRPSNRLASST